MIIILLFCYSCCIQVSKVYEARLEALDALERHLLQARARTLAEDEQSLSSLSAACPAHQNIGLPNSACTCAYVYERERGS